MIGICDICRYGQTDKCTNPDRDNQRECFVSHTGTTIAEERIKAEAIDELFGKAFDVDMDSSLIYIRFDRDDFDIPFITRKEQLKEWFKEKLKEQK